MFKKALSVFDIRFRGIVSGILFNDQKNPNARANKRDSIIANIVTDNLIRKILYYKTG